MKKEDAQQHIQKNLQDGDAIIDFFQGISPPKLWLFFLIGPFFLLSARRYFVAFTRKGVGFHKLTRTGKFEKYDFFAFDQIEKLQIDNGMIQKPMKFFFKNNRKLKIKAQVKGAEEVAKLNPELERYIRKSVKVDD